MKKLLDIGERKAIGIIFDVLSQGSLKYDGVGDDCAFIDFGEKYLLVSTDMISEKTHLPRGMSAWQIGWFIVAINLSDLAAKGGEPIGFMLSLGLPRDETDVFLKKLIKGVVSCADFYNTPVLGGDTKETAEVTVCGTVLGTVKKDLFMSRRGAKPGDVVVVTGFLGEAAAGFLSLENEKVLAFDKKFSEKLFEPHPRIKEGVLLSKQKVVTSCMDISDGLSSSLYQLSAINNVGFRVYKEKLPVSSRLAEVLKKTRRESKLYEYALHFGGDYELLFTLPARSVDVINKKMRDIGVKISVIGVVTREKTVEICDGDVSKKLPCKGYEHFKDNIC